MQTTHVRILSLAALAAGLALAPAMRAQQTATAPAAPAPTEAGYGVLGQTWTEVDTGWIRQSAAPKDLHAYDFTYNQPLLSDAVWGLDGGFAANYLTGSANGMSDHRDLLTADLTGFVNEGWGKPFLSANVGGAWDRAGGYANSSYAYGLSTGVEFQVVKQVAVSPFLAYEATPRLSNQAPAIGTLDDHEVTYGVKGTYRFTERWNATLAVQQDARNSKDLGWTVGAAYCF